MLPSLIHPDQTGFVKGRYIGENIRLMADVMEQTRKLNLSGILLSLDFQKGFDTLEWSCIHHVLKLYNFGDSLRNWVKVFYTDIESAILNNGLCHQLDKTFYRSKTRVPTFSLPIHTSRGTYVYENSSIQCCQGSFNI